MSVSLVRLRKSVVFDRLLARLIEVAPDRWVQRLAEMIEEAAVDAYSDSELVTSWFTMIDENLAMPFETSVRGVLVTVLRIALTDSEQIVAICQRERRVRPFPSSISRCQTRAQGAEWIEAYRHWRKGQGL